MRSKPRIDVIGSCVSRDVFNSRFTRDYRDYVDVGVTSYQTALPSIAEQAKALVTDEPDNLKEVFSRVLRREYLGDMIQDHIDSRPDFILLDFFADIHFGVTRKMGRYVTRNHMAFQTLADADAFFGDVDMDPPERMRFDEDDYKELAIQSLRSLFCRVKEALPRTEFIVNSARFSTGYMAVAGSVDQFPRPARLLWKNSNWRLLDEIAAAELGAQTITHEDGLFISSAHHPWGLHPVHYAQPYYGSLWRDIRRITTQQ